MDYWHVALMPINKSRVQHYVFTRGMIYYARFKHGRLGSFDVIGVTSAFFGTEQRFSKVHI
jgi:hypothetical protein